ncbi:hypothetical protein JTE90_021217 [Oedothorax gibbosus]|uniref:PAS domain-containing protein n=1 Tax=Oedothorax gibbosus TaxID=931172 RepID=A0AAV6UVQ9_9ARAC|nr:hypothetical protein JTE90_021217 [Oedothorax gibbosus]
MRSSSRSGGSTIAMDIFEQHQGTHILQSLDGFAFALSADGRFLYISETVSIYLGLSQVEMTGSSVFDYIHQQDHAELAEQLGINLSQPSSSSPPSSDEGSSSSSVQGGTSTPTGLDRPLPTMQLNSQTPYKGTDRSFCIRMKSTLTKRGCHFKSSGYRVVLVLSHLRPQYSFAQQSQRSSSKGAGLAGGVSVLGMVALAIALPPPSINEVRLESDMFVTRLTFEFRVAHCEPRVSDLLDYTAEDFTGKNMYTLCHGQDVQRLRKCHIDLIHKGQAMSSYYRLLNKNGGFTWLQTCATVICNSKNSDEQSIICVNYVLSSAEYGSYVLDCSQMPDCGNLKPDLDPGCNAERSASPPDTQPDHRGGDDCGSSRDGCCSPQTDGRTADAAEHLRMVPVDRCSIRVGSGDSSHPHPYEGPDKPPDLSSSHYPPLAAPSINSSTSKHSSSSKKRRLKSPPPPSPTSPEEKIERPWKRATPLTVRDLEDVMNKHLPEEREKSREQRSTIQWIGGAPQPTTTTTLPASSLLRQIYVNRESVIRSGTHLSGRYYEPQSGASSPPEPYHPDQFSASYPTYMDSYSTPPASVSPRDKYTQQSQHPISDTAAFSEAAAAAAAAAIPHMQHHYDHLPLKPQVFVHPGVDYQHEHQQYHVPSGFQLYHKAPASQPAWYPQANT